MRKIAFLLPVIFYLVSCSSNKESRVVSFTFGGYDTTDATLNGQILEQGSDTSKMLPLQGVQVRTEDSTGNVIKQATTDNHGTFMIDMSQFGTFNIVAEKDGYEKLKVTNYKPDSGQVAIIKIILAKKGFSL